VQAFAWHAVPPCDRGRIDPKHSFLQVGLRGQVYGEDDFDFARKHKVSMITAEEFHEGGINVFREHCRHFAASLSI